MDPSRPQKPEDPSDLGETVVPAQSSPKKTTSSGAAKPGPGSTQVNPGKTQLAPAAPRHNPNSTQANLGATAVPAKKEAPPKSVPMMDATMIVDDKNPAGGKFEATRIEGEGGASPKPKTGGEAKQLTQLGDFKIIKKLGQGGMGEVFLAHQISLDRDVALKVMAKQFSAQETFVKRFKREAQTMAKLDHPNIVRGFAVGEDQGLLFLAMELIKGKSMQDWMDKLGKLSVGDALHVTLLVAEALKHAHEINLIHRDIKPDNILVTEKGVVKVSDMGLAKATDEDMSMTQSGTGLGTPYYMPPEQARNAKHVDHRSDIYALGCTLYHFVTGKLPFAGASATDLVLSKEKGNFKRAKSHNSEVPERLDLIIDKMLAKDPNHRYQSCDDLIRDLDNLRMASEALSFIDAGPAASRLTRPAAGTMPVGPGKQSAAAPKLPDAAAQPEEDKWYLYQIGPDGKPKKLKMSTALVLAQLKAGALSPATKACKTSQGDYVALGTFREFEQAVKQKAVKVETDKKSEQYQKLYKKIERQQRWYPYVKWFRNRVSDVKGAISLVVYLAVLLFIAWMIYSFWPDIVHFIREKTGTAQ